MKNAVSIIFSKFLYKYMFMHKKTQEKSKQFRKITEVM